MDRRGRPAPAPATVAPIGRLTASYTVEIDAPLERTYEAAADVPGATAWNPAMETVEVLETDAEGRAMLVRTEADAVVKRTTTTLRFSYDPPTGLRWRQERGDVKSLDGRWEFEDLGDGRTRATYALEVDPGRVLGMLLRGPVEARVKEFLTKGAAEGLKAHLEGGEGA
ncbi:MAG TPA: SRPBCC family protein [Solirubrobacterales bacterium]